MKFLHTSDWHLGATLAGHERLAEQELFLKWLLDIAVQKNIQALLVAGDIYDTINPSIESQRLLTWFLVEMHKRMPLCSVIVIAGNHDSAGRLEVPAPFAHELGKIHIIGSVKSHPENCLIPIYDSHKELCAWCLALPFLRPTDLDCKISADESPEQAFVRAVSLFYEHLRNQAAMRNPELPVLSMGHCTVTGSDRAGSERLLIGGVESLPSNILAQGADYVALGHIHKPQAAGAPHIRYSGSPYAMDCDERRYQHQVVLVECSAAGAKPTIESIAIPHFVPMLKFPEDSANWEQMRTQVQAFDWSPWTKVSRELWPLVEFAPKGCAQGARLRELVDELCTGLPIRLIRAYWHDSTLANTSSTTVSLDLGSPRAPEELFIHYFSSLNNGAAPDQELLQCFREAVDTVAVEGL